MEPLKPCPYCGNTEIFNDTDILISCERKGCPIEGLPFSIKEWNTRTESPKKTCRDCRWWEKYNAFNGECTQTTLHRLESWHDWFNCGPDFGCILHKKREGMKSEI